MPQYEFEHVHLLSTDAIAAGKFYEVMFGAKTTQAVAWNGLPRCDMKLGGMTVLITTASGEPNATAGEPHSQMGIDHFGFFVDDMAAAAADLKSKGAEFSSEPHDFRGAIVAYVRGPDGVSIELVQLPPKS